MNQRLYLDLKQRLDLTTFIHRTFKTVAPAQTYHSNWHIKAMAHYLGLCASGKIKRLLITLPPRHLKSILPLSPILPGYSAMIRQSV